MSLPFEGRYFTSRLIDTGELPKPRWQARRELRRSLQLAHERSPAANKAPPERPTVGEYTGLCLLIGFPDLPVAFSAQEVDEFCNLEGYSGFQNRGCVRDYFREVSAGRLHYRTVVAPPYTAVQPRGHYTDKDVPYGQRARELIAEALHFHVQDGFDFSGLTVDAQRGVYAINVLYAGDAGPAENWGTGLWPHASRLTTPIPLATGRIAADYQIAAMGEGLALGVYCHENGHMLCDFPDLYPYAGQRTGVGNYCLMGLGAVADVRNPTQVCAYLKYRAGWGNVSTLASGPNAVSPALPNQFLIHKRSESEYFIIELRRAQDRDAILRGSGLAVWHVDEQGSNATPEGQAEGHRHAECVLLQADGLTELDDRIDSGDDGDLLNPSLEPAGGAGWTFLWRDSHPGLRIHSIEARDDGLRFIAALA